MERSEAPLLIAGFYRSGTTLLRRLIDTHSAFYCGPQIKFFSNYFGAEIDDPLAGNRLFKTLRDQGIDERELLKIWGAALLSTYQSLARTNGKRRWADKNPDNILYLDQWDQLLPKGFLLVYIVRHPVDALASLQEIKFERTVPQNFTTQVALYDEFNRLALNQYLAHPDRMHVIRYEDLVRRPRDELESLVAFLDEPFEPSMLLDWTDTKRGRGIEDPKIDTTHTINTTSIGRGYEFLTDEAIIYIESVAMGSANTLLQSARLPSYGVIEHHNYP